MVHGWWCSCGFDRLFTFGSGFGFLGLLFVTCIHHGGLRFVVEMMNLDRLMMMIDDMLSLRNFYVYFIILWSHKAT